MRKPVLFVILEPYADWEAAYLSSGPLYAGTGRFEVKTVSLTGNCGLYRRFPCTA